MGVVLFHLSLNLQPELSRLLPNIVEVFFSYGYLGVPIFFVISGFVISYSVSADEVDAKYARNFILRRSIRLDLTYWASIFFSLALLSLKNTILSESEEFPSITDIILTMFYLQEIANADYEISVVYWTLCLEVQFYLFYIFTILLSRKVSVDRSRSIYLGIFLVLAIYSIILDLGLSNLPVDGLFVSNWHYFVMGLLVCQVVKKAPYSIPIFFFVDSVRVLLSGCVFS